jgi:hypothetical protein
MHVKRCETRMPAGRDDEKARITRRCNRIVAAHLAYVSSIQ